LKTSLTTAFYLHRYSVWLIRHYRAILAVSTVAAAIGLYYSVHLYQNLRTDMEELLPENAASVRDLKAVENRVSGLNHLSIVIESENTEAAKKLTADIAAKLRELPHDLVARVEDNILEARAFFEKNKALYIDVNDWQNIEEYVRNRASHRSKQTAKFDIEALKKKYAERSKEMDHFPGGYFSTADGKTRVVLAFLPGKVTGIETSERLSVAARNIVNNLNPLSYAPDMQVGFDGDVQNLVEERHGIVNDLIKSSVICTLAVGLAMLLFFKSVPCVIALCTALFMGTAFTFGLSYWLVGYLNANTAFLGSIIIGNGINFGIIILARYLEDRRGGMKWKSALPRSIGATIQATWTAALAAGLSYESLVLTDFRGFNQFGVIGGLGMVLCWFSFFLIMPAFLILFEKKHWIRVSPNESKPFIFKWLSALTMKYARTISICALISIVMSLFFVSRLPRDTIESDFTKLRNKWSLEHGSGFWGKKVDTVFGRYLTPTVILTNDPKDTENLVATLSKMREEKGERSPVSDFHRVEDFLPNEQMRKIRIIEHVKGFISARQRAKLKGEDLKLTNEFLPAGDLNKLTANDLPENLVANFRESDGTVGRMVHVYPHLQDTNFWDARPVIAFANDIREAVKRSAVGAFIAGQPPLSADMINAISTDGPKATLFALLAVVFLVFIIFPRWRLARSVLASLLLGVLWMAGVMGAFNLKINFLNFIALPITFGIGVDYAVNIFSRYRLDGYKSIGQVIEHTGGAVALCSLTTIIGYSSLLLAGNQAFVSFGRRAVLGEITCLTAAIIVLPAYWHWSNN
jgi:predicted RND superfamily exporter protein